MVTPQTNTTLEEIARLLKDADDVVICGHTSPDGDCIGSTLALVHGLRSLGKRVQGLVVDPVPENLLGIPGAEELELAAQWQGSASCFVAVDVPDLKRMGSAAAAIHEAAPLTIRVDHHAVDERYSRYSYTDPDAVSTTVLVWELLEHLEARKPEAAECCYAGLVTDSGRFEFQNTDERAFCAAAQMVAAGVDPARVSAYLYERDRLQSLQVEMRAFERMELDTQLGYAMTYLTAEDFREFNADKSDAEGVVDLLRRLKDVRVLCCLREQDGKVRLSFRSKCAIDVREIARGFGGGGHVAASGATLEYPLAEAYARVKEALVEACRRHG